MTQKILKSNGQKAFEKKLREWLDSKEHEENCYASDHGHMCCLDNEVVVNKLLGIIVETLGAC